MEEPFDVRKKLVAELGRVPPDQDKPKTSPDDYAPKFKQPAEMDSVLKNIPIEVSFLELMKLEEINRQRLADNAVKFAPSALEEILTRIKEIRVRIEEVIAKAKASGEWYQ